MLKVFDYECQKCDFIEYDVIADPKDQQPCKKCGEPMVKLVSAPRAPDRQGNFQPFWSDTMQTRINDREDLQKLRKYAKDKGLVNVGHRVQKADKAAIRYNYEHD